MVVDALQQPPVAAAGDRTDLALGVVVRTLAIAYLQEALHIQLGCLMPGL
jgi:hypothetical protein